MINPMGPGAPWSNAYLEFQQKEQSSMRFIYQYPVTNLMNRLEDNQSIYDSRYLKKQHPSRNLPQNYRERKYVCPDWIRPTKI